MKNILFAAFLVVVLLAPAANADPGTAVDEGEVGTTFAAAAVQFDLVTSGKDQYAAYFNEHRDLIVKHRVLPDGLWDRRVIQESSYNPEGGRDQSFKERWDSHNYPKMAVDGSGRLHLAADMHAVPIRYWRSDTSGDPNTLSRQTTLVDSNREDRVTYPEFILRSNGNLGWLMFRNGASGDGETYVYEWKNGSASWVNNGKVFGSSDSYFGDGTGAAYPEVFSTLDGWYHLVYNWRESEDANSLSRVSYVKTRDFVDYVDVDGQPVIKPATGSTQRPTVDPLPSSKDGNGNWIPNGLINGEVQFITMGDYTILAYTKNGLDSNGNTNKQVFVAVHDSADAGWDITQVFDVLHDASAGASWDIAQVTEEPGGVGLVGNNYPDNYIIAVDCGLVAIDFEYSHAKGQPTRRVTFPIASFDTGPFTATNTPDYYPASVYPVKDSFPGTTVHFEADSRTHEQTGGIANRNYGNTRPVNDNTLYVMGWLAGPDMGAPPKPEPSQSEIDSYPVRSLKIYKITY